MLAAGLMFTGGRSSCFDTSFEPIEHNLEGGIAVTYTKLERFPAAATQLLTKALLAASDVAIAQQSTTQFAAGVNTPQGGLVLAGTGINPATGNPFRHLWTADPVNGLCRLDPDVDTVAAHSINL